MGEKDFFYSKSTWGALFILLAPLFNYLGLEVDNAAVIENITVVIGAITFVVGQFTRKTEITSIGGLDVK